MDAGDGVRWLAPWMQHTGVTAYAHEVYRYEWEPLVLREEQLTDVARDGVPGSMPESLGSKSKHELPEKLARSILGTFLRGNIRYSMFPALLALNA